MSASLSAQQLLSVSVMAFATLMTANLNWYKEIIYLRIWKIKKEGEFVLLKSPITEVLSLYLL